MAPTLLGRTEGWYSVLPLQPLLGPLSGSPRKKGYVSWCARSEVNPHIPRSVLTVKSCTTKADSSVIANFTSCFHCTLNPFHVPGFWVTMSLTLSVVLSDGFPNKRCLWVPFSQHSETSGGLTDRASLCPKTVSRHRLEVRASSRMSGVVGVRETQRYLCPVTENGTPDERGLEVE